jgi:CMP-N,N'-diacetyllegionaminic acid synthase
MDRGFAVIQEGRALAVITARGGSKGLPGKNVRAVAGKPLIVWTIEAGLGSKYVDRLILSSDDETIISVARDAGCDVPFRREARLAADDTSSIDVVLDAIERCPNYEWLLVLQPTSPLRTSADIDAAVECCIASSSPSCISVCAVEQNPHWMYREKDGRLVSIMEGPEIQRRQELPPVYIANGAIYVAQTAWFLQHRKLFLPGTTVGYQMPVHRSIDIDDIEDLQRAETILLAQQHVSAAARL